MNLLISCVLVVISLHLAIVIHELGHYIAAKILGIKVSRFLINAEGFIKIRFKAFGTFFRLFISLLPQGGCIKLEPFEINDDHLNLKMIVIIMGPLANLLFALFFLYIGLPELWVGNIISGLYNLNPWIQNSDGYLIYHYLKWKFQTITIFVD